MAWDLLWFCITLEGAGDVLEKAGNGECSSKVKDLNYKTLLLIYLMWNNWVTNLLHQGVPRIVVVMLWVRCQLYTRWWCLRYPRWLYLWCWHWCYRYSCSHNKYATWREPLCNFNYKTISVAREVDEAVTWEVWGDSCHTPHQAKCTFFYGNPHSNAPVQGVNFHVTQEVVNVDEILEYTAIHWD
jgi:hypothetical protein